MHYSCLKTLNEITYYKVKIDKNIKWRADNQASIVEYINNRENGGDGNNGQYIATSTMLLATVLALNN